MDMMGFDDFFSNQLIVSRFPELEKVRDGAYDRYAFSVNVSDIHRPEISDALRQRGLQTFWFPQGEAFGISLASLYGALRIIWNAEKNGQALLLHCHSGRNRSVMVADCYFFLRTGQHRQPGSPRPADCPHPKNQLFLNIDDGQLPGIYKMEEFLTCCQESFAEDFPEQDRPLDWIKLRMRLSGSGFSG